MLKQELIVIVRSLKPAKKSYVIDNLVTNAGHTILRLPPYHCVLNPIELAWVMVKEYVKRETNNYTIDDVQRLLNEAINRVTTENWMNFIKHTIEEENKLWQVDDIMEELIENLEPCVLTITGDKSDDESE
ncbi:uncharacterized protein LOC132944634 [Metopolophium dirhodum]|uniref:uncharacterized protein LOC132944634 n=1 Tax=Metopolophium dirhodum TaxID=44670 RepID=UPI00298F820C|nr:uncharacterized protein LOC132944634 [Metopolophium dirhodum]